MLFQYASFINTSQSNLALTSLNQINGLNAFLRLISCVFFNANRVSLNDFDSPVELFKSFSRYSVNEQHSMFLERIRKASWQGTYEHELLPSLEALQFHWNRSCWVSTVWGKSLEPVFDYPLITQYGWVVEDGVVSVVWDTVENMKKVRDNVVFLTKGCGCKSEKNKCVSGRCKCFKNGNKCDPGCSCKFCENCLVMNTTANSVTDPVQNMNMDRVNDATLANEQESSRTHVGAIESVELLSDSDSDSEVGSLLSDDGVDFEDIEQDGDLFFDCLYENSTANDIDSSDDM